MIVELQQNNDVSCSHCNLPVPSILVDPDCEQQFCCQGCAAAYQLIHEHGLESFYDYTSEEPSLRSQQNRSLDTLPFQDFDSINFLKRHAKPASDTESTIVFGIEGIHCAACVWLLEKLPTLAPGVVSSTVDWPSRTIQVRWRTDQINLSDIAFRLDRLGYSPYPYFESERAARTKSEHRKHLIRIGVAAALAGNNMMISAALYFGMFSFMSSGMEELLRYTSCVLGIASLIFPGRTFLTSALSAIRTRTPHMDLPISLALALGTIAGTINVLRGHGEIYFDSLSMLIVLLLVGRWLQFRQQAVAADSVEMLSRLTPRVARKIINGKVESTLVELLKVNDELELQTGDLVPADGHLISDSVNVDEAILTGESEAVLKNKGQKLLAGSTCLGPVVRMRTTAVGRDTEIAKLSELVHESGANRPKLVRWADRIGGYFVVAIIVLATITLIAWLPTDAETALDRTIALLVVACPCALALATPLAISVAQGRAAKRKILIKNGDVLQAMQNPGTIWLDKTGTLTFGEPIVEYWHGKRQWAGVAGALGRHSQHPISKALVRFALEGEDPSQPSFDKRDATQVKESVGKGVSGTVDGQFVIVGNQLMLEQNSVSIDQSFEVVSQRIGNLGYSLCWVAVNGQAVALAGISDQLRPEASHAISELRKQGWQVGILSGDRQVVVDRVAEQLEIEPRLAIGESLPETKLQVIQQSGDQTVVMVGDGVNDSAALAGATVGLAVKGGSASSLEAAPVFLAKPGLGSILELLQISRSTGNTMRWNLTVSLAYNIAFASLAIMGWVSPLVAAVIMPLSSLSVVTLSLRAGTISPRLKSRTNK